MDGGKHVLSCRVALLNETRNNPRSGVLVVEGIAELLTRGIQLLLGGVHGQNHSIPFVL